MHKIAEKEFTLEDFSCEHLTKENDVHYIDMVAWLQKQIDFLNVWRRTYLDVKDSKVSASSAKKYWWQMIQLLPSSYNQARNVMLNYEVLANIYRQRHSHKLDEWRELCKWIESLPYSEVIIAFKEYDTVEYAKEHPDFADRIKDAVNKMTKSVHCENKSEEDENNV